MVFGSTPQAVMGLAATDSRETCEGWIKTNQSKAAKCRYGR